MADTVLSAQMTEGELYNSIDKELSKGEKRFDSFVTNVNKTLGSINANFGDSLTKNFNSQIDNMSAKIKQLEIQLNSLTGAKTNISSPTTSTSKATPVVNVNDIDTVYAKEANRALDDVAKKQAQINQMWAQYETEKQGKIKTTEQVLSERYAKEQSDIQKVNATREAQMSKMWDSQEAKAAKEKLATEKLVSNELRTQETLSARTRLQSVRSMPEGSYSEVENKLRQIYILQKQLENKPILSRTQINGLSGDLDRLKTQLKGFSITDVMAMPTGNLNQITAKMSAISTLRGNYSPQSAELAQLNREYQNLSKTQNEALNAGIQLEEGNNKLATTFENLSKRVIFYTGLGALTGFVTQLYSIRGEYEMIERSMGAILGSFQEGSKIFNQIQQQALQSPMTVIDLSNAAKQLIAYNFGMNEVATTTKKMADISSALGVPMERMIYNLGQIKAQGFLTARDARDFANAGLAVVPKLAEMYSNLNGKVVTTSEVYDMLTKKMVPYSDVMKVINRLTDKGGMFFDYQAKQAETLKGQLSNLVDAWNLMLNQIGQSNEGVMKGSISALRELFTNWRTIESTIEGVVVAYGLYKAAQILTNATIGQANLGLSGLIGSENRHRLAMLQRTAVLRELSISEQEELNSYRSKSTLLGLTTSLTKEATVADYQSLFAKNNLTTSQARWMVGLGLANKEMMVSMIRMKLMTAEEIRSLSGLERLSSGLKLLGVSLKELGMSIMSMMPQMAAMLAITALASWWSESKQRAEEQADLNKSIADQAKQTVDDINQYLKDNQPTISIAQKSTMGDENAHHHHRP